MYDVISFGSATIDVFIGTEAMERRGRIEYPVGTKILVKDVDFQTGGCGMNVAIALKRLGCNAAFLGKLGSDENSRMIMNGLRHEGVPFVGPPGEGKSGYSVILDSVRHNRTILHYRGASNCLKLNEVKKSRLKTRWFYLASALGDSFRTEKMLADFAARKGTRVAYNPGIAECKKGREHISKILKITKLLILNTEEGAALSGKRKELEILKALRKMGPKIVCITNGSKEILCYDGNFVYRLLPHRTPVVERTGAGDAFSAGMLAGMVREMGVEYALQLGLANAESVIRYVGARNKLLSWEEAAKRIRNNPGKMRKVEV